MQKLAQAYKEAPDNLTPGHIDYTALMRSTRRGEAKNPGKPADLVKLWTEAPAVEVIITDSNGNQTTRTAHRHDHKPVVKWTESGHTPEAITPGIDYRTAEVLNRDSYRQTAPKATPPALTPKEQRERDRLDRADEDTAHKIALYEAYIKAHPWLA